MLKLKLMLISMGIGIGLGLILFSWYASYPVSIDSPYDFIYNHISPLYWLGSAILFALFFIIAINTKNNILRWIIAISTVLLMYSESYFFYALPGSDYHVFRGLTEDFVSTGDLSLKPFHSYYKWPLFFILTKVATLTTGFDLRYLEFLFYCIIGFVFTTSIYVYASRSGWKGYVAVVAFFITQRYFFNYQWVPFSLSFGLLFLLFALDSYTSEKDELTLAELVIFLGVTLAHAFVAVFFIIYLFIMYFINRREKYLRLFLSTLVIYLVFLIFYETSAFTQLVEELRILFAREYAERVEATIFSASSLPPTPYVAIIAQNFSRIVVVATSILTFIGFSIVLLKRKFLSKNYATRIYACLLTGLICVALGLITPVLGTRAFPVIALPASIGASYFTKGRFKRYFESFYLILIILFPFILINGSFYDRQIQFQTKKEYLCANFLIEKYDWQTKSHLFSHIRLRNYLQVRSSSTTVNFDDDLRSPDFLKAIRDYDCIVYTVGVGISALRLNSSTEESLSEFEINHFDLIYDSGDFSYIYLRAG